jgi:acetyltransferase-like isoleucine patch superfamily enzyme
VAVRGREKFAKFKPILNIISRFLSLFPMKIRKMLFEHYRRIKGIKGIVIRYVLLKSIAKKCGDNVSIHPDCYIFFPERLEIGDNVSIHPMCYIDAVGGLSIGNDVSIAHAVTVMTSSHHFNRHDIPIKDQDYDVAKTEIGDNVWIGAKATILCGNNIGYGSVVGAGAIVTHNVQNNTINVGAPAKAIKER